MTTDPQHDVHVEAEQEYDISVVVLRCWTCRDFKAELGAAPSLERVVAAAETHTGQPAKCQSVWQRGVFCQRFYGHEGKHRHEDRGYVGEWSD